MKYKYNGQWYDLSIKALDGMNVGSIILWPGAASTIPTGWLLCDGTSLSEEEYPELYDVIGHIYGGSGLDFNLPDYRDRTPVGYDANDDIFNQLGKKYGSKALQEHSHNLTVAYNTGGTQYGATVVGGTSKDYLAGYITNAGTGNGGNIQPSIVQNYIIKATNTTPTMASVVNATNNSTIDAYSCNYINGMIESDFDTTTGIGYVKYPDGTCFVYGTYATITTVGANTGENIQITLPFNLKDTNYSVVATKYNGGNGYANVEENTNTKNVGSFVISLWNRAGASSVVNGYMWQVIGKWK